MRKKHNYYVYITTNPKKTVLYIGVTNNLARRLVEHYTNRGTNKSFAGKYYAYNLIYYEQFKYITEAITREKELKKWSRQRKNELIATTNPDWRFNNNFLCGEWPPQKIWCEYMTYFKNKEQKQEGIPTSKEAIAIENDTVRIYKDEPASIGENAILSTEAKKISNNSLQRLEDEIWQRQILSQRELYLVTLSILVTTKDYKALSEKVESMPTGLLSQEDIDTLLLQIGLYAGLPIANEGKAVIDAALAKKRE
ncbi:MAG: GIY-YIG nuclease family protein [Bacteroidota bacterium]